MTDASARGKRNRRNGQAYERLLCKRFETSMPGTNWKRRTQTRGGRVDGSDIEGCKQDPDGVPSGVPIKLFIEAHNGSSSTPSQKLKQAQRDAPEGWLPIAIVHTPNRPYSSDMAAMPCWVLDVMRFDSMLIGGELITFVKLDDLLPVIADWVSR